MIKRPLEWNAEFRVLDINLVLKRVTSAPEARDRDTRLKIKCIRKTAFRAILMV